MRVPFISLLSLLAPLARAVPTNPEHQALGKRLNSGVGRTPALGWNNWVTTCRDNHW